LGDAVPSGGADIIGQNDLDCDLAEALWIKARDAKQARKRFFEHIRTITEYLLFPDWRTLIETLIASKSPPEIEKQIWT
jgi:hypothetical protein